MASFKWDKTGHFCSRCFIRNSRYQASFQQRCEKSLHRVHSSCFKSKGLCNEDGYNCSGKCRCIYADAQQINEDRKAAEEPFEDEAAEGETEFKETDEAKRLRQRKLLSNLAV